MDLNFELRVESKVLQVLILSTFERNKRERKERNGFKERTIIIIIFQEKRIEKRFDSLNTNPFVQINYFY